MKYKRLDLNLLIALDALLATANVSRAAAAVHITQPAMSSSLARLREYFNDPLLTPIGRKMALTPLALALIEPTRRTMESIDVTLASSPAFEPAMSKRTFVIAASDYSATVVLQPLVALLAREAPGVHLEIISADPQSTNENLRRREVDFLLMPEEMTMPEHPRQAVLTETFCCVVWKGNTEVKNTISVQRYLQAAHVATRYGVGKTAGYVRTALERHGARAPEVTCSTPLLLCSLVIGTNRIATVMRRLAVAQAKTLPIRLLPSPIDLGTFTLALQWHQSRDSDSGMVWFRGAVARAAGPVKKQ